MCTCFLLFPEGDIRSVVPTPNRVAPTTPTWNSTYLQSPHLHCLHGPAYLGEGSGQLGMDFKGKPCRSPLAGTQSKHREASAHCRLQASEALRLSGRGLAEHVCGSGPSVTRTCGPVPHNLGSGLPSAAPRPGALEPAECHMVAPGVGAAETQSRGHVPGSCISGHILQHMASSPLVQRQLCIPGPFLPSWLVSLVVLRDW